MKRLKKSRGNPFFFNIDAINAFIASIDKEFASWGIEEKEKGIIPFEC